jgi:hypothetical protein
MSLTDLVRGLPRFLPAASPAADFLGHGVALGDDLLGLLGGEGCAVGVTDHVGHAAVHDHPGPLGQMGSDADRAKVVVATLDHLDVVDAGQLGVDAAGVVGGADRGGPQQPVAGLAFGLALAVGVAGFGRLGARPVKARNFLAVANRWASPMVAARAGPPTSARPGRLRASPSGSTQREQCSRSVAWRVSSAWVRRSSRTSVWTSAARAVKATAGWSAYSAAAARAAASHWVARWAPWWPPEALAISRVSRAGPAASRAWGRRRCVPAPPGRPCPAPLSAGWWAAAGGPGP